MFLPISNPNTYADDYKSTGIILTKNISGENYFLFLIEPRSEHTEQVVHIIGGKKNEGEYPHETIAREAWEESHGLIGITDCINSIFAPNTIKYWYNRGKYILYIAECPEQYIDIDKLFSGISLNKLIWISNSELSANIQNQNFTYTNGSNKCYKYSDLMIKTILSLSN